VSAQDDPNKFLALIFAWMDGRILAITVAPLPDAGPAGAGKQPYAVLFHIGTEDGGEKLYAMTAHSNGDKVRCTRLTFDYEPEPDWPQVKLKAIELFPGPELSRKTWDRARQDGWCSRLFTRRGRRPGQPSKRRSRC
jgi:hypothetical protein